jgi:putative transposase
MNFQPYQLYHVYNRGNNRQQVFFSPQHYLYFIRKIRAYVAPCSEVLAYCLMPNHFHLLLYTTPASCPAGLLSAREQPLVQALGRMLSSYSQGLNQELGRTGSVFQSKTKAKLLATERHAHTCLHYLHQNPLRALLTPALADWPYSSYRDYAGLRGGTLCNRSRAADLLALPTEAAAFVQESEQVVSPALALEILYC